MPGTVLGTGDIVANKTEMVSALMELTFWWGRQTINQTFTNEKDPLDRENIITMKKKIRRHMTGRGLDRAS